MGSALDIPSFWGVRLKQQKRERESARPEGRESLGGPLIWSQYKEKRAMLSDQEIAESLDSLFRETNPNSFTSIIDVVHRLQTKLGFDLSHKLDFIRAQISLIFNSPPPAPPPLPRPPLNPQILVFRGDAAQVPSNFAIPRNVTEINFAQPGLKPEAVEKNVASGSVPEKGCSQSRPKRQGGPGGLNKLCGVSPELQAVVGQPALPRTEIVKQLWSYIRKNNLQDPSNKRKIVCNDELRLVFETDCTDMFQMNKLLAKHIFPLDPTKESGQQSKKLKAEESEVTSTESNPVVISKALASFLGASGREMFQSEVNRHFTEYIKAHGLEDPLNSIVVCDAKLQELFECETIPSSGVYSILARRHLFPRS